MLTRAFVRTKGRLSRLYETYIEEYWTAHKNFSEQGFSLHPKDICMRCCKVATILVGIIIIATFPVILYKHGFNKATITSGPLYVYLASWFLFFAFIWIAHGLWTLSYIIGTKFASSDFFWGYIEKRWTSKIDEITEELLHKRHNNDALEVENNLRDAEEDIVDVFKKQE